MAGFLFHSGFEFVSDFDPRIASLRLRPSGSATCSFGVTRLLLSALIGCMTTIPDSEQANTPESGGGWFGTTHWSVVLSAGCADAPDAAAALERLCAAYWYPLYAYVRRRGHSPADAQDLTQEFFARLLEGNWVAQADRTRGRFRSFLLMALNRFLANEWHKSHALKRGGGLQPVPLALDTVETRFGAEPAVCATPELEFDRQWAMTLLEQAIGRLHEEYTADGKGGVFEALKPCLVGSRETQPYAALAEKLGMTEGAVKVAVNRLRQHYRERLREEIAQTVLHPEEVDSEMRHLVRVLARG